MGQPGVFCGMRHGPPQRLIAEARALTLSLGYAVQFGPVPGGAEGFCDTERRLIRVWGRRSAPASIEWVAAELAAVPAGDSAGDGQAESGAGRRGAPAEPHEALENAGRSKAGIPGPRP
jgi:hypothetical protein